MHQKLNKDDSSEEHSEKYHHVQEKRQEPTASTPAFFTRGRFKSIEETEEQAAKFMLKPKISLKSSSILSTGILTAVPSIAQARMERMNVNHNHNASADEIKPLPPPMTQQSVQDIFGFNQSFMMEPMEPGEVRLVSRQKVQKSNTYNSKERHTQTSSLRKYGRPPTLAQIKSTLAMTTSN